LVFGKLDTHFTRRGTTKLQLEVQVGKTSRVSKTCFQHTPIGVDEEMEDIKEIDGTNTQLESSRQLEISLTLLPALWSWNLG
jgi:hypothetical protein